MQNKKYILMSIKPLYAEYIKSGQKTMELRRLAPHVQPGDILIIYESSPVQRITSYCDIDSITIANLDTLWQVAEKRACLTHNSFISYFANKKCGAGISLTNVHTLKSPIRLNELDEKMRAPQSYRYISEEQFRRLLD